MDKSIKQIVKNLLLTRNHKELLRLCQTDKRYWRTLQLYLYETEENLRWPAIEAFAELMKRWWLEGSRERVREYIRRLLWLLNEESGGIGWSSPEVIAETIVYIPELLEPYGSIMIAYALKGRCFLNSSLWAIGRMGKQIKEVIALSQDKVLDAFDSDNPETLSLAAWAMGEVGFTPALKYLTMLRDRKEIGRIYIDGHFQEKSLGRWSKEAIDRIGQ
ncbi:DVU0298 family protein [Chloroflexota bacterium]